MNFWVVSYIGLEALFFSIMSGIVLKTLSPREDDWAKSLLGSLRLDIVMA